MVEYVTILMVFGVALLVCGVMMWVPMLLAPWRGASFSNLSMPPHILPGCKVADCVAIVGSVDPIFGEVDR